VFLYTWPSKQPAPKKDKKTIATSGRSAGDASSGAPRPYKVKYWYKFEIFEFTFIEL
jgi:hypothetical protein